MPRRFRPRRIALRDTELHTWFERDRAHVALIDAATDSTLIEWWDDDVASLVQDGLLDPRDWHASAYEYAAYLGVIARPE